MVNLNLTPTGDDADTLSLVRMERQAQTTTATNAARWVTRAADTTVFTETWANTTAWTGTGTVASGRVYSSTGLTRTAPTSARWMLRTTLKTTGVAGNYAYLGVGSSTSLTDMVRIGQGTGSTTASVFNGTNTSAGSLITPRAYPALASGNVIVTIVVDETHVSLMMQGSPTGQTVYGSRIPKTAFPGGVVNTIYLSANDTAAGGMNWGPVVIYNEIAVPPLASRTVGGVTLFDNARPLAYMRADTTGIGHVVSIPGDTDMRIPAPVCMFMHQADTGTAMSPWTESRWSSVLTALNAAGYVIVSSDNGTGITGGGTQDKFGNLAGITDYTSLASYVRAHVNTGPMFLLGASMGGLFTQNILARRAIGGIAAAASICPAGDLLAGVADPALTTRLLAAYGASSTSDFTSKVTGYNPMAYSGSALRGVPQRFYVASDDTTMPPSVHVAPLAAKIAAYAPEAQIVTSTGGHLATSTYNGSDLVSFFNTYR